eukprot:s441_g5.t1
MLTGRRPSPDQRCLDCVGKTECSVWRLVPQVCNSKPPMRLEVQVACSFRAWTADRLIKVGWSTRADFSVMRSLCVEAADTSPADICSNEASGRQEDVRRAAAIGFAPRAPNTCGW